uniref:CRISPR-associated endonuclease/helicase Cas3 n=1 Tax=Arsenophonus endosymbiont of Trialeurodes vaporariorum TaxID=235567 RepID=A0A3B0LUS6_9GAMM
MITQLRSLDCTLIILSATLTSSRRTKLLGKSTATEAYPLITAWQGSSTQPLQEYPVAISQQQQVNIEIMPMEHQSVLEEVLARAELGEQVLWIENTVAEAQERYFEFAARAQELGIACGLLHSRFTYMHRQNNEQHWVHHYGKSGWDERIKHGRILIGTQVLEQSLDIDADLLVTRFAPSDMLLQRLGRLWRHQATPRPAGARCQAWILAPEYQAAEANPRTAFGATASVYNPYI